MARPIYFAGRFRHSWKNLSSVDKERIADIVIALPDLLKDPHRHSGFGLRRIQGSGLMEARLDIRRRLVMQIRANEIVLYDVMNHDQVRRLGR
jgi:mRNA-degrading endonuclease RelE of RelBE toxin-antitoxin system